MYKVNLEQFSGPFDLLLKLIKKQELDICNISLAKVADSFLQEIKKIKDIKPEKLASFLEIAAQLLLIKSRLVVPSEEEELEEDNLAYRLQIYKEYAKASVTIENLAKSEKASFFNEKNPEKAKVMADNSAISSSLLNKYYRGILKKIKKQLKITKKIKKIKIVSLKKKISDLKKYLKNKKSIIFNKIIKNQTKSEKAAMFLAALELLKQNKISINQEKLFGEIIIKQIYE